MTIKSLHSERTRGARQLARARARERVMGRVRGRVRRKELFQAQSLNPNRSRRRKKHRINWLETFLGPIAQVQDESISL